MSPSRSGPIPPTRAHLRRCRSNYRHCRSIRPIRRQRRGCRHRPRHRPRRMTRMADRSRRRSSRPNR